jgi:alpha-ribazole phosphatase/probable phosphoglycerate mutase
LTIEIVFETHSWSVDNERGIATGWLPGRLSKKGKEAARELGERRRGDNLTAVFTSDLHRAVETAEIAFRGSGIPIYQDQRLRECNYGLLNGSPVARLITERSRHIDHPFAEGESYRQVVKRVQDFLDDLTAKFNGARVLLIGHSATLWALDHLLHGTALEDLVSVPFQWREGWLYILPTSGTGSRPVRDARPQNKPAR